MMFRFFRRKKPLGECHFCRKPVYGKASGQNPYEGFMHQECCDIFVLGYGAGFNARAEIERLRAKSNVQ